MCLISKQYLLIGGRDEKPSHNTYYLILLDFLINTRKDVDLLYDKKILVNYLGDNNVIKFMINNLHKDILEECLICFKMCGDGKKYIYIVRYGVCNMFRNYM